VSILGSEIELSFEDRETEPRAEPQDERAEVAFWRGRIERRKQQKDFTEWESIKKQAREFYKGNLLEQADRADWGGDTVELNMWRRIYSFFVDAVFSTNPNISVRPAVGRSDERTLAAASSVQSFLEYVWREKKQKQECKRALKDAWFGNISSAKMDFDSARGLWAFRWMPGLLIVDEQCHGDLSRAMWIAEEISMPIIRILRDDTFPRERRARLAERWGSSVSRLGDGGLDSSKKLYYVYTREGSNPPGVINELLGGGSLGGNRPEAGETALKKLMVICEDFDEFLYEADNPCPYLDEDEYPVSIIHIEELPGDWYGSPPWKALQAMINALNWLMTYHIQDMKKKATDIILVNKQIVKNPNKLVSDAHMTIEPVDGDPNAASARLNIGKGDMTALASAEQIMNWLDRISGFNEISRGESTGRKTAEEARYLQQNSSLVSKGPTQALDQFIEEVLRQIALASIYYIPQWSRKIGPDGSVVTSQVQDVQNPLTGAVDQVPGNVDPDEARSLGAEVITGFEQYGLKMPGTEISADPITGIPSFSHPNAGITIRRGTDFFCGPGVASGWPTQKLDDVKRDLLMSFESGSTRADFRYDQQQAAMGAMQLLGGIYTQNGFGEQMYELILSYTRSLPLSGTDKLVPPREMFVQAIRQAAMAQQQPPPPPPDPGPPPVDPIAMQEVQLKGQELQAKMAIDERRMSLEERTAGRKPSQR